MWVRLGHRFRGALGLLAVVLLAGMLAGVSGRSDAATWHDGHGRDAVPSALAGQPISQRHHNDAPGVPRPSRAVANRFADKHIGDAAPAGPTAPGVAVAAFEAPALVLHLPADVPDHFSGRGPPAGEPH